MQQLLAILLVALSSMPAAAQQPWEGLWVRSGISCNDETGSALAIRFGRTEVEGAAHLCRIVDIKGSGKPTWAVSMRCTEGGPSENVVHTLRLTRSGTLIRRDKASGAQEELARCTSISEATRIAIRDRRRLLACEGAGCAVTAVEWNNLDEANAWALVRPGAEDAEAACATEQGVSPARKAGEACLKEQLAKAPVKVSANCLEGSTSVAGRPYRITDAARDGALPHAGLSGYWDTRPPHSVPSRTTIGLLASWFRVLCPTTSPGWNMIVTD